MEALVLDLTHHESLHAIYRKPSHLFVFLSICLFVTICNASWKLLIQIQFGCPFQLMSLLFVIEAIADISQF